MRSRRVIAVATILIAGFGVTLFSLSRPTAQGIADIARSSSMNGSQAHGPAQLPVQKMHDMSVVFSQGD
jgi:hypothetical protein